MLKISDYLLTLRDLIVKHKYDGYGRQQDQSNFIDTQSPVDMFMDDFVIKDKGCEIRFQGIEYPMTSWISADKVIELAKFKRIIPMFGRFLFGKGEFKKKNIFQKILIAVSAILYKEYLLQWLWWAWRDLYLPENKYNQPAREMYQAIADEKVRDIVCAILEYDMAYRLRFQDIMAQLNKEQFFKNPRKEISRLFDILTEREHDDKNDPMSLHQRWSFIKLALNIGLMLSRKLVKQLTDIVCNLDLQVIAPTESDQYWMCSPAYWGGYNFMGMTTDERKKKFKEMS